MPAEAESIGFLLARIHNNMDRQANNNLKSSGMTFSQMRILYYLLKHGEAPPSQKDIEDFLQVSHPTVVGLIKRLEAKGLVHSGFDSTDRRVKSVYLTAEGWGFISAVREHNAQMEQRITAGMDAQEVECLRLLLRRVLENILNDNGGQYAQNEKNT